jgi:hypothetical protein
MLNGLSASREMGTGQDTWSPGTPVADDLHDVLRRHATAALSSAELRAAIRPMVRRARGGGATIEQLLVALKRAWAALPEARLADVAYADTPRRLDRVVTLVIETYYEP